MQLPADNRIVWPVSVSLAVLKNMPFFSNCKKEKIQIRPFFPDSVSFHVTSRLMQKHLPTLWAATIPVTHFGSTPPSYLFISRVPLFFCEALNYSGRSKKMFSPKKEKKKLISQSVIGWTREPRASATCICMSETLSAHYSRVTGKDGCACQWQRWQTANIE